MAQTSTSRIEIRREDAASPLGQDLLGGWRRELTARYGTLSEGDEGCPTAEPAEMAPPSGAFLVARLDGRPGGCGGVKRLDARTGEVKRMYVDPGFRRQGLARRLLEALEGAAREIGYARVRLDTGWAQPEAHGLYRSAGYAEIPAYNRNPYATLWFEKRL